MEITLDPDDSMKFKVPSLRNVVMSYPYMHDGRFRGIRQVLDHYTSSIAPAPNLAKEMRQPMPLTDQDKKDIISFLGTLTDQDFLFDKRLKECRDD
jgi:cytochrome c peroxidase